jgi:hypothetical protein
MPAPNGQHHEEAPITALIPQAPHALAIQLQPDFVLAEATRAAKALQQVLETKPNKCIIRGKQYLQFEDWQTLGRFYGVTVKVRSTNFVSFGEGYDQVRGFEATADALLATGNQVISSAEAMCLDDEDKWHDSPFFQLRSMAQTRACAKALRNVLSWVVVLAGYEPTPSEEMDGVFTQQEQPKAMAETKRSKRGTKAAAAETGSTISFMQQKELFDLAHEHGRTPQDVMRAIAALGYAQPGEIPAAKLDKIRAEIARKQ